MQRNQEGRRDDRCSHSLCPTLWWASLQAQGICAGIYVLLPFGKDFMRCDLEHPLIVAIPPVFLWVLFCGTTYIEYVHLGNCVTWAFSLGGPATFFPHCYLEMGDIQHPHDRGGFCMLPYDAWGLMLLCFHQLVKERAFPSCPSVLRIQNFGFGSSYLCECQVLDLNVCGFPGGWIDDTWPVDSLAPQWHASWFDQTLGFPGEGPHWSMISANVDSFATNASCLQWDADVFLLQEARIAESNMQDAKRKAAVCNFEVYCSQPLQKLRASNGTFRIPSGGTATCARKELTQLFHEQQDMSGSWELLRSTARVTATWHQVSSSVKLLAFNFYAIANAASERAKFERNNEMLNQLFMVAAQFGDIPIVIAGDFQMEPGMYPAVQLALDNWGWSDPLLQTDAAGELFRPSTFFQTAATEDGEGQSSIDGILMNRTALTALVKIEVLEHLDRQHRPVQAYFAWTRIQQVGTVLQNFAKLDLERAGTVNSADPACPVNLLGEELWRPYQSEFENSTNADKKWEIYNE